MPVQHNTDWMLPLLFAAAAAAVRPAAECSKFTVGRMNCIALYSGMMHN
jgi:hypothetical protein